MKKNLCPGEGCFRSVFLMPVEGRRNRWVGWSPDWDQWTDSPGPLHGHTSRLRSFWGGCWNDPVDVAAWWKEGSTGAFLMTSTSGRLLVLGGNPFHGFDTLDSRMGICRWDLSLGQCTSDVRFDGETFLGGLLIFFLGGRGRGRGTPGHDCRSVFVGQ